MQPAAIPLSVQYLVRDHAHRLFCAKPKTLNLRIPPVICVTRNAKEVFPTFMAEASAEGRFHMLLKCYEKD